MPSSGKNAPLLKRSVLAHLVGFGNILKPSLADRRLDLVDHTQAGGNLEHVLVVHNLQLGQVVAGKT